MQEVNRNISSPAFLGLVGMRMDVIKQDEAETVKNDFEKANKGRHFYREYSEASTVIIIIINVIIIVRFSPVLLGLVCNCHVSATSRSLETQHLNM